MSEHLNAEIVEAMREARRKARGYADFFGWAADRDLEEWGVMTALAESLEKDGAVFFSDLARRGRGNDPPDLEAIDSAGRRIGFELTELVDGDAIVAFKSGRQYDWADWSRENFLAGVKNLLVAKNGKFPSLKDAPYSGGYVVVIFTDEPSILRSAAEAWLGGQAFSGCENIDRAFVLLSYDPEVQRCPYFELELYA